MTPKEKKSTLTSQWLRDNLVYEPSTGVFMWKVRGPGRIMGKILGTEVWPGYLTMKVDGTIYYAHRIAWLYVHGKWPEHHLDHIDGDKSNNAIENLREATSAQNAASRPTKRRVASSRGVMPHGAGFVARIHHGGKRHYLGYFPTAKAAQEAYELAAKRIHGEFAYQERIAVPKTEFDLATAEAVARSPHRDWLLVATPGFRE